MTIDEIKRLVQSEAYDFLRKDVHLGNNIILLGLGGSYAYGTNNEDSDIDVRGCALDTRESILTEYDFEQFTDVETDTTIYAFHKLIQLLTSCNPNTIEMLGNKPEHYLYMSDIGKELIDNRKLFLSKRAIHSFGGYATAQLRRLDNKAARLVSQSEQEMHILNSIENSKYSFKTRYFECPNDSIRLYVDKAVQKDFETEIFMDVNLTHYPLRDYKCMWSEMHNIVKDYAKIGKRNQNAIEHNKLGKHMMHLVRLYYMCFDILENGEINTYREAEHEELMAIRNGKYLDENRQPIPEFSEVVDELEKRLDYAAKHTELPEEPNKKEIREFVMSVNERVVRGEV